MTTTQLAARPAATQPGRPRPRQAGQAGQALRARIAALEAEVERLTEAARLAGAPWRLRTVQADFFPAGCGR